MAAMDSPLVKSIFIAMCDPPQRLIEALAIPFVEKERVNVCPMPNYRVPYTSKGTNRPIIESLW